MLPGKNLTGPTQPEGLSYQTYRVQTLDNLTSIKKAQRTSAGLFKYSTITLDQNGISSSKLSKSGAGCGAACC